MNAETLVQDRADLTHLERLEAESIEADETDLNSDVHITDASSDVGSWVI